MNAAIAAGLVAAVGVSGGANAVELSPDGVGQVLIYPYYTVNRNQQTVISVVNATNAAKAVRVRFLEGYNAREVLDFNLFLSEFDVWTASVFALADAGLAGVGAALLTADYSCTAPSRAEWTGVLGPGLPYQEFRSFAYTGTHEDSGPTGMARTREGHIELVQMADLVGTLRTAVTHRSGGIPANCNIVQSIDPAHSGLLPPTGGLFGAGGIVDVAQGTFHSYNADAVGGFSRTVLFSAPGMPTPSLAQANTTPDTATAHTFDAAGELFRSDYPASGQSSRAIDAVSAVFMASTLLNEYNVDASAGSSTDWVVTFPTKRFYTDPEILGVPLGSAGALPPFTFTFGQPADGNGNGLSCSQVGFVPYDREEGRPVGSVGFPGLPPVQIPVLCGSVNVIGFISRNVPATESVVLGSKLLTRLPPFSMSGWLRLSLDPATQPHTLRASRDGDVFNGLPATGFQAVNYVNANVTPGVLSNYSATFRHRVLRTCVNAAAGGCS
ncbi:hypothetical protein [Tahibacter caeni]|uniref:hypothetical protein n=1 Tax=Tahibacter caeni TaxID=1453545 RepID=UPI002147C4D2|nr:hypothetical protein [Tahibacter caeni]